MPAAFVESNPESLLTEATSFTTTPILMSTAFSRRCCRVLVFPDLKNPDSSVMGILLLLPLASSVVVAVSSGAAADGFVGIRTILTGRD